MKKCFTHDLPIGIVLVLAVVIVLTFGVTETSGRSMEPTCKDGDLLLVNFRVTPKDGDVLILNTADMEGWENSSTQIVKRYSAKDSTDGYYVLGDNAEHSYDSRYCGEIDKERLIGVAVCNLSKDNILDILEAIITGIFSFK